MNEAMNDIATTLSEFDVWFQRHRRRCGIDCAELFQEPVLRDWGFRTDTGLRCCACQSEIMDTIPAEHLDAVRQRYCDSPEIARNSQ